MTSALPGGGSDLQKRARERVGTTLCKKYHLDDVIGIGGMAIVYRATHRNQAEFAIKMLLPELSYREDLRTRFLREGLAANSVKHDGVVRVVDDDVAEDGSAFLVMDLLQGSGVDSVWAQHDHKLPMSAAVAIVDQLLDVLDAAHRKGIIHRDIKPANLFLTTDGSVKVLDFGIARVRDAMASDAQGGTGTGMLLGTPAFMAPEQAKAVSSAIDAQTDVWAAGATLFTLVCGRFVHDGDNGAQLLINAATTPAPPTSTRARDIPAAVAAVIDKALAFDKGARWRSAEEMRSALRDAHQASFGSAPTRDAARKALSSPSPTDAPSIATQQTVPLAPVSANVVDAHDVASERQASAIVSSLEQARVASHALASIGTGATTAQPISSRSMPVPPMRSRAPLWLGLIAVFGVSVIAVVASHPWRVKRNGVVPPAATSEAEPPAAVLTVLTVPTSTHIEPLLIAPEPSSTPRQIASTVVVERPMLSAAVHSIDVPTHSSASSGAPPHTRPPASCYPPFYFDQDNIKQWKKGCY